MYYSFVGPVITLEKKVCENGEKMNDRSKCELVEARDYPFNYQICVIAQTHIMARIGEAKA